jgi:hypothetical protein
MDLVVPIGLVGVIVCQAIALLDLLQCFPEKCL